MITSARDGARGQDGYFNWDIRPAVFFSVATRLPPDLRRARERCYSQRSCPFLT
jgi:hypothetical protein